MEMLAAQAAHREDGSVAEDESSIVANKKLSDQEKKEMLQKSLNMAASNGDVDRIQRLVNGDTKDYIDINAPDEEGTAPLIYASCFVSASTLHRRSWLSANAYNRGTKTLSRRSLMRAQMWISKTETSGAPSCGQ